MSEHDNAPLATPLTRLVGITHPIMQDGMGPFSTVALAIAVSNAGGLGSVSVPGLFIDPDAGARTIREHIDTVLAGTSNPIAVNVPVGRDHSGQMLPTSAAYIDAVIAARKADSAAAAQVRVLTTSGGFPGPLLGRIRDSGLLHFHKVGATAHARKAAAAGVDAIIASGYEMGGHTHARPVHTFVLAPNVTEAVTVPVIVSGGVRDARGLAAALCFGAAGVAMGTRFIVSEENTWHPRYAERILSAQEGDDTLFPGTYSPVRGIANAAAEQVRAMVAAGADLHEVNRWKAAAFARAQRDGDVDGGLVAAGQVASGITSLIRISEFVPRMAREAAALLADLHQRVVAATVT